MKLIMENWKRYLTEQDASPKSKWTPTEWSVNTLDSQAMGTIWTDGPHAIVVGGNAGPGTSSKVWNLKGKGLGNMLDGNVMISKGAHLPPDASTYFWNKYLAKKEESIQWYEKADYRPPATHP